MPEKIIHSVSSITNIIQKTLERNFSTDINIRGEVSGFIWSTKGHIYFDLIDDTNNNKVKLKCVIWKSSINLIKQKLQGLQNGLSIICVGKISTYGDNSQYQLVVKNFDLSGIGAQLALIEKRKQKLAAEGLFDDSKKKRLPYAPSVIGVITSISGAVIRDIIHRIRERFPLTILIWNVQVQGIESAKQIVEGIEGFNNLRNLNENLNENSISADENHQQRIHSFNIEIPEILIIARGGGSAEDMSSFNDESVVRAAAASKIPIVSAIGHEIDRTLLDLVADLSAPTPTAAAEKIVPVLKDEKKKLEEKLKIVVSSVSSICQRELDKIENQSKDVNSKYEKLDILLKQLMWRKKAIFRDKSYDNIGYIFNNYFNRRKNELIQKKTTDIDISTKIENSKNRVADFIINIDTKMQDIIKEKYTNLRYLSNLLDSVDYMKIMKRGFSVIKMGEKVIKSSKALESKAKVEIEMYDGAKKAVIE